MSRLTDIIVAITCVVLLSAVAWKQFGPVAGPTATENPIRVGAQFEWAPTDASVERTVLAFVHSQCKYCTASMELYREIQQRSAGRYGFRVLGLEPVDVVRTYLREHGVDAAVETRATLGGFRGTPSMVVLDRQARVLGSWTGVLDPTQKERLWSLLP